MKRTVMTDIEKIVLQAQHQWLRKAEIRRILSNYNNYRIASEPPRMPRSGSLFLYNRKVVKHFRNDGHNWRKTKDGKTLKESHGKLMDEGVEVLQCYYARGAQNNNLCTRIYWLIEEKLSHIVLVHYLEEEGKKASVICSKEYEESNPCAQQTYEVMANTEMETSQSSNLHRHSYNIQLQTNGAQASECEETELACNSQANSDPYSFLVLQYSASQKIKTQLAGPYYPLPLKDDQERLPVFRQVDYIPLSQANETRYINNVESACEPSKLLAYYSSWQHILDNTAASYDVLFQPSFPEIQSNNMEINSTSQQYEVMGQPFSSSITKQHQNGSLMQSEGNWQASGFNSLSTSGWLQDGDYSVSTCEISYSNNEHEEPSKQSTSNAYWDTIESENGFNSTIIPSQDHFDDYVLYPSIFCDKLFSIINISPSCTFEDSEIKVFIFGQFLKSQQEVEVCKWSCMFGEVEVPAEIIGDGVLCCHTPLHKAGRVHFYVTCSNRLACSEVHEFDFRVNTSQEINTAEENTSHF